MLQGDDFRTDLVLTGLKPKVIAVIGDTKSGSSTLSSIFAKHPFFIERQHGELLYKPRGNENIKTSNSLQACTTICNRLDFEEYSLLDMPAIDQNQTNKLITYISFDKLFKTKKEIKFILTISEAKFRAPIAKERFTPFINYLNVFENALKRNELLQRIFQATRIVITKTTLSRQNLLQILKVNLDFLRENNFNIALNSQLLLLINFIANNTNIIDIFPFPKDVNQDPIYLQISNDENWQYLNILEEYETYGDFWKSTRIYFDQDENKKIEQAMQVRKYFIQHSYIILKSIISICTSNDNYYRDKIDYDEVTGQLQQLLNKYKYSFQPSVQQIDNFLGDQFTNVENARQKIGLQVILLLKNIYNQIQGEKFNQSRFQQMTEYFDQFKLLFKKFKELYCSNTKQHELFKKFSFYFLREIQNLCYGQRSINFSKWDLLTQLQNIFQDSIVKIQFSFIQNLTIQRFINIFSTAQKQEQYIKYADSFILKHQNYYQIHRWNINIKRFKQEQLEKQIVFIITLQKQKLFVKAIGFILSSFQRLQRLKRQIQEDNSNNEIKQLKLKQLKMKMIIYLKNMADCLKAINKKHLAGSFYKHIEYPTNYIDCLSQIITQTSQVDQKIRLYFQLGDYCLRMGNKLMAWDSYYKALENSVNVAQRERVQQRLKQFQNAGEIQLRNINYMNIEMPTTLLGRVIQQLEYLNEQNQLA